MVDNRQRQQQHNNRSSGQQQNGQANFYSLPKSMSGIEWMVQQLGFKLVKDGSRNPIDVAWLEKPTQFTRVYYKKMLLGMDGEEPDDVYFKIIYDYRKKLANFQISNRDLSQMQQSMDAKEFAQQQEADRLIAAKMGFGEPDVVEK